ncbi:MAG: hypothetical protein ACYTFQ_22560 [Planctomycetota bacterium]|jgi:hypothetical protein
MAEKKEQEEVDQDFSEAEIQEQHDAALDWDEDVSKDLDGDEPWEEDEKSDEGEGKADDEVAVKEDDEPEVATKDDEESTDGDDSPATYTLDGEKYTAEEVAANPELLDKMATHYNQVGNFQKLLDEEREAKSEQAKAIEQLEAEKQAIEREWVARKMSDENEARKRAEEVTEEVEPTPRPANKVLQAQLKPYIDQLKEDGRLTEDELDEHKGLIAEYIFDQVNTQTLINKVAAAALQKIDAQSKRIEQIESFVNPAIQSWSREQAERDNVDMQKKAAAIEGYDELSDPENWEKLMRYVSEKVAASPKNSEGRPTFDPIFDAETMAAQWDAMNGPVTRKALAELKKRAEAEKKEEAKKAGGSAASGGKTPKKKPKPKGAPTAEDEALDWGDGRYAG